MQDTARGSNTHMSLGGCRSYVQGSKQQSTKARLFGVYRNAKDNLETFKLILTFGLNLKMR